MSEPQGRYSWLAEVPFEGGYPTAEAATALDDELFFQRATQVYLWALPAMNMLAMKRGLGATFGEGYQVMSVFEERLKPRTAITTPNSDVIYGMAFADLAETGPLVIEAPPRIQGLLDDFWHRPLTGPVIDGVRYLGDIGIPGPDKGAGGRYVVVPDGEQDDPKYDGDFVYSSRTNGVLIFLRGFFQSVDDVAPGVAAVEGVTVRPFAGDGKPMQYVNASNTPADALFDRDGAYFDRLDEFIQSEQVDAVDPYLHGMLASLGIVKGGTFAPTQRQRELLDLAARTGWRMAKNIAANYDQEPKSLFWEDRHWVAHVKTEYDDFLHSLLDEEWRARATGHTDVNAKAHMFVNHYSISTGMMGLRPGFGAKYCNAYKDSDGNLLRGENTYRIDLPADPPAKLFWSLAIYDADTASGVDADGQEFPSLNSQNNLVLNEDGTTTIYVGPERPDGALNWLKTVPGTGWFGLLRWYGPKQELFDRRYKPGDFTKL